jgi:hypothetical protein
MAATLVPRLPEGEEWLYELKLDGYRALLIKDGTRIEISSYEIMVEVACLNQLLRALHFSAQRLAAKVIRPSARPPAQPERLFSGGG